MCSFKYYFTVTLICLLLYFQSATSDKLRSLKNVDDENQLCKHVDKKDQKMCENIQKIIDNMAFELKNDINQKFELIIMLENDIKKSTDNIPDETDTVCKCDTTPKSIETMYNRLAEMESYITNSITTTNEMLENIRNKEINELANKIKLLITNTEQLDSTSKTVLEYMKTVNNKLALLENRSDTNITEKIQTSKTNQESVSKKIPFESEHDSNDSSVKNALCNITVPSSVQINNHTWKYHQTPAEDDLDAFMANKTGCSYKAIKYRETFYTPSLTFNGTLLEWRGAVRARDNTHIHLPWNSTITGYSFWIGDANNTITRMINYPWLPELQKKSTPGILSEDRYVSFYIRIQGGSLTFGKECEHEPLFTYEVSIEEGQKVPMRFQSWSHHGTKFLYECPASAADLP